MQLARQMMMTDGYLSEEFCHFDGKVKRVHDFVSLTASFYHPVICKQIQLATMECKSENYDTVSHFWRLFNKAFQELDNTSKKFEPKGWVGRVLRCRSYASFMFRVGAEPQ